MQATLIVNPTAGGDNEPSTGQIEALMKEAGYKVRIRSIAEPGWQRALKAKTEFVVVAGGDGTVGKVARRMIGTGTPLAVLPLGTANNISKTLGIVDLAVTQLISSWKSARRLQFDVGLAAGPWGERYFIEGLGVGLLTNSIPKVDSSKTLAQLPDKAVKVAYAQQVVRDYLDDSPAIDIEAALDGKDISGRYVLLEILNMQYIGPNLFLAPEVVPNNGEFEVILVSEKHRRKLHHHIKNWQEGMLRPHEFVTHRGRHLEMQWSGFKIHIDDKIWPPKRDKKIKPPAAIDIQVRPKAIEFLIPADIHEMQKSIRKNTAKADRNSDAEKP